MIADTRNPEKMTGNVKRARTGSTTGTVVGIEKGTGTRRGTVVTRTGTVITTTGSARSEAREGNTVTATGAMILKEGTVIGTVTIGIGLAPAPHLKAADPVLVPAHVQKVSVCGFDQAQQQQGMPIVASGVTPGPLPVVPAAIP